MSSPARPTSQTAPVSLAQQLMRCLPQVGKLEWIGIRPERGAPMLEKSLVQVMIGKGLEGDRFNGRAASTRQVTLIQQEHLSVIASLSGHSSVTPELLRRNLVVSGINLLALKSQRFRIGDVILEGTSLCAPCSKMEKALGPGGFNAMRGHGGLCARVIGEGEIQLGDAVQLLQPSNQN